MAAGKLLILPHRAASTIAMVSCFWTGRGTHITEAQSHTHHNTNGIKFNSGKKKYRQSPGAGKEGVTRQELLRQGHPRPHPRKWSHFSCHQTRRLAVSSLGRTPPAELERDTPKAHLRRKGQLGLGQRSCQQAAGSEDRPWRQRG